MAEACVQNNCHNLDSSTEHSRPVDHTNMGCCDSKSGKYTVSHEDVALEVHDTPEREMENSAVIENNGEDTPNDALKQLRQAKTNDDDDSDIDGYQHEEEDPFMEKYYDAYKKFEYFWKSQSIYSQWHMSTIYEDDIKFICAEQYMMYHKAVLFGDEEIADSILRSTSPRKIKQLGREVRGFVEEVWQYHCLGIVKKGNAAKFSNNKLRKELISTYPKTLVEASPYDRIWGIGLEENDPDAWDQSSWRGTNYLGYILTEVRNDIMIDMGLLTEDQRMNYVEEKTQERRPAYEECMKVIEISKEQVSNRGSNQSEINSVKDDPVSSSSSSFTSDATKNSSFSGSNSIKKSERQQSKNKNKKASGNRSFDDVAGSKTNSQRGKADGKSLSTGESRGTEKEDSIEPDALDKSSDNTEWKTVHHGNKKLQEMPQGQLPSSQKDKKKRKKKKKKFVSDEDFESKNRNPPKSGNRDGDNKDQQSGSQGNKKIPQDIISHKNQVHDSGSVAMSSPKLDVSSKQEVTVDAPGKDLPVIGDNPKESTKMSRRQKKNANKKNKLGHT